MLFLTLWIACDKNAPETVQDTAALEDTDTGPNDTGEPAVDVTPGGESCESPVTVTWGEKLDCSTGWYAVDGNMNEWPGDCVCTVSGALDLDLARLPPGAALSGLTYAGRLKVDGDAAGDLFGDLSEVGRLTLLEGSEPRSFPALTRVDYLWTYEGTPETHLVALESAELISVADESSHTFPALRSVGTLSLSSDQPGLSFPSLTTVTIELAVDAETPSDGQHSFPSLTRAEELTLHGEVVLAEFPVLEEVTGPVTIRDDLSTSEPYAFPALTTVGDFVQYGDGVAADLPSLTNVTGSLRLIGDTSSAVPDFPALLSVDTLLANGVGQPGTFPVLEQLDTLFVVFDLGGAPADSVFPSLGSVRVLEAINDAQVDLGAITVLEKVGLQDQAEAQASVSPSASELGIHLKDSSHFILQGDADSALQITASGQGALTMALTNLPGALIVEDQLYVDSDTLTQAGSILVKDDAQLDLRALQTLAFLELDDDASFYADALDQLETLIVYRYAVLSAPALTQLDTATVYGDCDLSGLLTLGTGKFVYGAYALDSLTSAEDLTVDDCSTLGALSQLNQFHTRAATCPLPSLSDSVDGAAIELTGGAEFTLPDGLSQVLWFRSGTGSIHLERPGAKVLLEGGSATPAHRIVDSDFAVEIDMPLATSLGTLSDLQSARRLRYCLPGVPQEDLDSWLDQVEVSGTVTNTCP